MSIFGVDYDSEEELIFTTDLNMGGNRIKKLKNPYEANDAVNKRYVNKRIEYKAKYLESKLEEPRKSDLDMGNNRIINVAQPRNPEEYENDVITSKVLYDYIILADKKFLKTSGDGILDGKLDMNQRRIIGLANPIEDDNAVNKRYVSTRVSALTDAINQVRYRLSRFESTHPNDDAATKLYIDTKIRELRRDLGARS